MSEQQLDMFGYELTPDVTASGDTPCSARNGSGGFVEISAADAWEIVRDGLWRLWCEALGMTQAEIDRLMANKVERDLVKQFEKKHPRDRKSVRNYLRLLNKHEDLKRSKEYDRE